MNLSLKGKTALVCGSTQGIGKASAIELAKLGATCVLMARDENKLAEAIKDLDVSEGQKHQFIVADFQHPNEIKEKAGAFAKSNTVHILVNNTGGPNSGPIVNADIEEFRITFNNHLICNHILMQAVVDGMKKEKYGRIINIISTSVKVPLKNLGVSNTIRAAVANWSKTLANEVASFGITVNNVLPGATNTIRLQSIIQNKSEKTGESIEAMQKEMLHEIPMGRFADPSEIAAVVAFLASPAASYITGINVPVDGGRTGSL
ncbi:MAG: SDR family oxidoreductase [Bacteroidetes bacterium]|nr:SDR family oxidoreductase [Bacteroidota bacterium]